MEEPELIKDLPPDIALECLTRLPYAAHGGASRVCRRWQRLFGSRDFYFHRKRSGFTRHVGCLVQSLPASERVTGKANAAGPPACGVSLVDVGSGTWQRLESIPDYPDGIPLFCQLCGVDGKIVLIGGWDPARYTPSKGVYVYDFSEGRWRRGRDMPSERSFFGIGSWKRKVYVAGGHDGGKNALKSAWAYDLDGDEWSELPPMSTERDECEGVVVGDRFWVLSGYCTERQGAFGATAEVLDLSTGEWSLIDGAWETGRCPRTAIRVDQDGRIRPGPPGISISDSVLLIESLNSTTELLLEREKGEPGRIPLPAEFRGFIHSGCHVEI